MMLLAPMNQRGPPEPSQTKAKSGKAIHVSRYRVVVEVALNNRSEPPAGMRHWIMPTESEVLLDLMQLSSHPFADRFALYHEVSIPVAPADMREAQEIERLWLSFSSLFPVLFGETSELYPARFVWVQLQTELRQSFPKIRQEAISIGSVLESESSVIGISDDKDLATCAFITPSVHP
jgi:hypothetical protein